MIFTPVNAQKVMAGTKTQTRRPIRDRQFPIYFNGIDSKIWAVRDAASHRIKWQVGKTYAVQPGRGKPAVGRILLKSIREERVNEISESDAIAEGIKQSANGFWLPGGYDNAPILAFRDLWNSIYSGGMAFETGPLVWVLEFECEAEAVRIIQEAQQERQ